jgi:hypothetical protein
VVLDVMDGGAQSIAGEGGAKGVLDGGGVANVAQAVFDEAEVGPVAEDEEETAPIVDAGLAVDGDVVEVTEAQAGFAEAEFGGFSGEAGPVLDAPEALFFGGSDDATIANEAGGGVAVVGVEAQDGHTETSCRPWLFAEGFSKTIVAVRKRWVANVIRCYGAKRKARGAGVRRPALPTKRP